MPEINNETVLGLNLKDLAVESHPACVVANVALELIWAAFQRHELIPFFALFIVVCKFLCLDSMLLLPGNLGCSPRLLSPLFLFEKWPALVRILSFQSNPDVLGDSRY